MNIAGVGDDKTTGQSWSYDGRKLRKYNHGAQDYPPKPERKNGLEKKWKAGDTVGCLLNLDAGEISFMLQGRDLGVAFRGVHASDKLKIYPCATLKKGPHLFKFSSTELKYYDKIPTGYRLFTVAADDEVDEQQSAEAARKKREAEQTARRQAMQHGEAWKKGRKYKPKDLVGYRVDMREHGQGMVMDIQGGNHVIKLDGSGDLMKIKLDYSKSKFKVQSERYVNQFVMKAMEDFAREELEAQERVEQVTIAKIKRKRQAAKTTIQDDLAKGARKKLGLGRVEESIERAKQLAAAAGNTPLGQVAGSHVNKLLHRNGKKMTAADRTPEELEEDVEDLFRVLDADGSGNVTEDELKLVGVLSGATLTHSQISQLLTDMDIDGDGSIIFEEFRHWALEVNGDTAKQVLNSFVATKTSDEAAAFELAVEIFEKVDTEQSGSILVAALEKVPDLAGVALSVAEVETLKKELTHREQPDEEEKIEMDPFCEWMMGKSRVAMLLSGRDAQSKKAKADVDLDDDVQMKLHVLCGPHTSIKGTAFLSSSFDTVRLCKGVFTGESYNRRMPRRYRCGKLTRTVIATQANGTTKCIWARSATCKLVTPCLVSTFALGLVRVQPAVRVSATSVD